MEPTPNIVLSPEAWRQLLAIEDAEPNEALLKAANEYREDLRTGRIRVIPPDEYAVASR